MLKFNVSLCQDRQTVRGPFEVSLGIDTDLAGLISKYGAEKVAELATAQLVIRLQNNVARVMLAEKEGGSWAYDIKAIEAEMLVANPCGGARRALTPRDKHERKLVKMFVEMKLPEAVFKPMVSAAMAEYDKAAG